MATNISALSFYKGNLISIRSRCSRERILFAQRNTFGYAAKIYPRLYLFWLAVPSVNSRYRKLNAAAQSTINPSESDPSGTGSSPNSTTRLLRVFRSYLRKLKARIGQLKKGLSIKVFFFLVGFYCATAFATAIGQTGDWDILSAGLAVVVVEGIGALMYRTSLTYFGKLRYLITVFNYWKAGLSLGLFLDAFKYEVDSFFESCNQFQFQIDISEIFCLWYYRDRRTQFIFKENN